MAKINEVPNCAIGEGSIFEGRFTVAGSIHIDGKFQGEIKTDDHLFIGPTGRVKTNISAKRVTVAGVLVGNISATEEVTLLSTGMVLGNIKTPKLNVEEGVVTHGEVHITAGKKEDIKKIINELFGPDTEIALKPYVKTKRAGTSTKTEKKKEA